jgi:hypothetical protein
MPSLANNVHVLDTTPNRRALSWFRSLMAQCTRSHDDLRPIANWLVSTGTNDSVCWIGARHPVSTAFRFHIAACPGCSRPAGRICLGVESRLTAREQAE